MQQISFCFAKRIFINVIIVLLIKNFVICCSRGRWGDFSMRFIGGFKVLVANNIFQLNQLQNNECVYEKKTTTNNFVKLVLEFLFNKLYFIWVLSIWIYVVKWPGITEKIKQQKINLQILFCWQQIKIPFQNFHLYNCWKLFNLHIIFVLSSAAPVGLDLWLDVSIHPIAHLLFIPFHFIYSFIHYFHCYQLLTMVMRFVMVTLLVCDCCNYILALFIRVIGF